MKICSSYHPSASSFNFSFFTPSFVSFSLLFSGEILHRKQNTFIYALKKNLLSMISPAGTNLLHTHDKMFSSNIIKYICFLFKRHKRNDTTTKRKTSMHSRRQSRDEPHVGCVCVCGARSFITGVFLSHSSSFSVPNIFGIKCLLEQC